MFLKDVFEPTDLLLFILFFFQEFYSFVLQ